MHFRVANDLELTIAGFNSVHNTHNIKKLTKDH